MKATVFNLKMFLAGEYAELPFDRHEADAMFAKLRTVSRKEARAFAKVMVPALVAESDEVHVLKDAFLS